MAASRARVDRVVATGQPTVYGINTGFGIFAARHIPIDQADHLSRNLIISHAIGIGEPFPEEVVRAAMLIRANTLAIGHSGIRPETVSIFPTRTKRSPAATSTASRWRWH